MVLFPASLVSACTNSGRTDRPQAFGEDSTVNSSILGLFFFFYFLTIRCVCVWVLGAFHGSLTPLKSAVLVHFGQLRELPIFQHREKGGELFSGKILKHHLWWLLHQAMKKPGGFNAQGSSHPQLWQKSCWRWEGRTPSSSTLTEEPPKSFQRVTAPRPNLEPKCTTQLLLGTGIWHCCLRLSRISADVVH